MEGRNEQKQRREAVEAVDPQSRESFRIECPYPLVADGLARTLQWIGLRHRQGPTEVGIPRTILLWAECPEGISKAMKRVRKASPDASVLVLGLHEDLPLAMAALKAGARGFVHAGMNPDQVARAISVVARGEEVVPRWMLRHLVDEVTYNESAKLNPLTSRQREVLALVAEDLSNAEIAQRLFLTESTVKQHLRAAYKVLGVNDRTEAAKLIRDANSAGVGRKVKR
jgi:DNA-binding NarL/FixJ family response regulator